MIQALTGIKAMTQDPDVLAAADSVLNGAFMRAWEERKAAKTAREEDGSSEQKSMAWPDNMRTAPVVGCIAAALRNAASSGLSEDKRREQVIVVAELALYNQLDTAIDYLCRYPAEADSFWYVNWLVHDHFGIPVPQIKNTRDMELFLQQYHRLSELDLYRFYLKVSGISIWNEKGLLDMQKIYAVLKYDMVLPFAGYGGIPRQTGIFAVTRLLEDYFNTSLGLPAKNEHSIGYNMVHSFTDERREKWMAYLLKHKWITADNDPPSFFDFHD